MSLVLRKPKILKQIYILNPNDTALRYVSYKMYYNAISQYAILDPLNITLVDILLFLLISINKMFGMRARVKAAAGHPASSLESKVSHPGSA